MEPLLPVGAVISWIVLTEDAEEAGGSRDKVYLYGVCVGSVALEKRRTAVFLPLGRAATRTVCEIANGMRRVVYVNPFMFSSYKNDPAFVSGVPEEPALADLVQHFGFVASDFRAHEGTTQNLDYIHLVQPGDGQWRVRTTPALDGAASFVRTEFNETSLRQAIAALSAELDPTAPRVPDCDPRSYGWTTVQKKPRRRTRARE